MGWSDLLGRLKKKNWKYSENYFQNIFKIIFKKKSSWENYESTIHSSLVSTTKNYFRWSWEEILHSLTYDFSPHKLEKPSPMKHGCLLPSQKVDNMKTINKWMYPINLFIHPSLTSFNPSLFITLLALIVFYFWVANLAYNVSSLIITMQTYELLEWLNIFSVCLSSGNSPICTPQEN
jgi:hypothetical protein